MFFKVPVIDLQKAKRLKDDLARAKVPQLTKMKVFVDHVKNLDVKCVSILLIY